MKKNNQNAVERIINLMQADDSVDAPNDAILWSKNIFKTRAVGENRSMVETIKAVLKIDLMPGKPAFGERSGSSGAARQMLFDAGDSSIDLRIKPTGKGFELRGQILGDGFANTKVFLGEFETISNDQSEFRVENVPSGKYNLIIKGDRTVEISGLLLKT